MAVQVTSRRKHRCLRQAVAGGALLVCLTAAWNVAQAQESRQVPPPRLFDRPARYDYAFDPYDYDGQPRTRESQAYRPYRYRVPLSPEPLSRTYPPPADEIYGYQGELEDSAILPLEDEEWQYGYYYDRETGELRYGWHYQPPGEVRLRRPVEGYIPPAPRPQRLRAPLPVPADTVRFEGEVIEVGSVTGRTDNRVHLTATVRQPDGTLVSASLGPIASSRVRQGDWVSGIGIESVLNGRPMILARDIAVNGNRYAIRETAGRQARNYLGQIVSRETVFLGARPGPQIFVRVQTGPRQVFPVLLGSLDELRGADLEPGARIEFWARDGTLDGRSVLIAEQVLVNERRLTIGYESDRSNFDTRR